MESLNSADASTLRRSLQEFDANNLTWEVSDQETRYVIDVYIASKWKLLDGRICTYHMRFISEKEHESVNPPMFATTDGGWVDIDQLEIEKGNIRAVRTE